MKILVVDDDIVARMVLMHLLEACGLDDIVEAEDGADAWHQLAQGLRPALCFCDLRMPRMSGLELLARVKGDRALDAMRFVLASADSDGASLAQARSLGADGYLVKPFGHEQLSEVLARLAPRAASGEAEAEAEAGIARATMRRLGISGARLLVYLNGFATQLEAARHALAPPLAAAAQEAARAHIERLRAGCATLGLEGAAARLAVLALAPGPLDAVQLLAALADALAAVRRQAERVRRTPGL